MSKILKTYLIIVLTCFHTSAYAMFGGLQDFDPNSIHHRTHIVSAGLATFVTLAATYGMYSSYSEYVLDNRQLQYCAARAEDPNAPMEAFGLTAEDIPISEIMDNGNHRPNCSTSTLAYLEEDSALMPTFFMGSITLASAAVVFLNVKALWLWKKLKSH